MPEPAQELQALDKAGRCRVRVGGEEKSRRPVHWPATCREILNASPKGLAEQLVMRLTRGRDQPKERAVVGQA